MKKLLAIILALACVLSLWACGPAATDLTQYTQAIANTAPGSAIIDVTMNDTEFGIELKGVYNITYNEDGSASVEFTYNKLNPAASSSKDMYEEKSGSATISADGKVEGDGVDGSVVAATLIKLNLTAPIKSSVVARGILTADIEQANTAAVIGVELPSDATLELRMADTEGTKIGQATINYTNDRGAVRIVCQYN